MKEMPFAVARGFFVSGNTLPLRRIHTSQQPTATNTPIAAPQIIYEHVAVKALLRPSKPVQNPIPRTSLINHNEYLGQTDLDLNVCGKYMTTTGLVER